MDYLEHCVTMRKSRGRLYNVGEEQQVDFDFCDPSEEDFHIIKALVHKMADGKDFDSSVLSDQIISDVRTTLRCSLAMPLVQPTFPNADTP